MAVAIKGTDGNPLTSRAIEGSTGSQFIKIHGQLTFSGTYTAQGDGGDTIDWTTIGEFIQGTLLAAFAYSVKPTALRYVFKKGTANNNWSLQIVKADGTEPATGDAYVADTVFFEALIRRFI